MFAPHGPGAPFLAQPKVGILDMRTWNGCIPGRFFRSAIQQEIEKHACKHARPQEGDARGFCDLRSPSRKHDSVFADTEGGETILAIGALAVPDED